MAHRDRISPKTLRKSKWAAVCPSRKVKHFLVTQVKYDDGGRVPSCAIEAIMSMRAMPIGWGISGNANSGYKAGIST